MSETIGPEPTPWFLKTDSKDSSEVVQLTEAALRRQLRRAGGRLRHMSVRKDDGDWYPAKIVLKKFEQLAREGIYTRHDGVVDGPFTAKKAIEVLQGMPLHETQAKVGIHADWVDADRLLLKLSQIKTESAHKGHSEPLPLDAAADKPRDEAGDQPSSHQPHHNEPSDDVVVVEADDILDSVAVDGPALVELVLVAEPVMLPIETVSPVQQPITPQPSRAASTSPTASPASTSPASASSALGRPSSGATTGQFVLVGLAGVFMLAVFAGIAWVVIRWDSDELANQPNSATVASPVASTTSDEADTGEPTAPPPVVRAGTLFRPSIETSFGQANGGTLFSARVGRSNRTVLLGAAHLLGPATGLPRQLRGREVAIHFQRLTTIDCVSGEAKEVAGKPIRLNTAEYPSLSLHGDSLAFEPDEKVRLQPLAIGSTVPSPGDPVWLLAPARGTEALVHSGRWLGKEDDWFLYRLDNQSLDMVGTSGGAVVDRNHEVVGIHIAGGESDQGMISIASPIKPLIAEIR